MVNVSGFLVAFHSYATSWHRAKRKIQNSLQRYIFFSFTPPRGTGQNFSTHCSIGPRPFFFYATSWHRVEVPDTLLNRSPTDFFFPRHLVAQSRSPQHTAQTVHATMWPDKQNQPNKTVLNQNKTKTAPKYIATRIHKKQAKKRTQTSVTAKKKKKNVI